MDLLKYVSAMLIFGTIGIFVRYIPMSSAMVALARGVIGAIFLLLAALLGKKKLSSQAIRRNLKILLFSGAMIGFNWILLFEAYRYTTIATATLCYYLAPVIVTLLSPAVLHERLTPVKGICTVTALLGMVCVSGVLKGGISGGRGILCGIGAACLYSFVVLANRFLRQIDAYESTIMQLAVAAAVLLPYTLVTEDFGSITLTLPSAALLLIVGILHTGFAYSLFFGSMTGLRAQTIAIFSYIDPVTAIFLSAIFLQEKLTIYGIAGAALILGSALVSELFGREKAGNS